jgi:CBS-domain-containing membrane protein
MTSEVVSATRDTSFARVVGLLAAHGISGLPVVDDDEKVVGVVSESDLMLRQAQRDTGESRRRLRPFRASRTPAADDTASPTAGELMSTPPITVRADDSVARCARIMAARRIERLPVLDEENRLVGIVTRRDLLQVFLRPDADIREDVIQEVLVGSLWLDPQAVGVRVEDGVVTLEGRVERAKDVLIAGRMAARTDGVVSVRNRLTARFDDRDLQPASSAARGAAQECLDKA